VPQSKKKAFKWYEKSAKQGFAMAQYNLGLMYYKGKVVPQNHEKALEWFGKAAAQGHVKAQQKLDELQ